ncbi:MAG TPA: protein kinase, partial [Gemmata sp.]
MVLTCPHCHRSLSSASADGPPQFCMFCGHKLTNSSTLPPAGARTQTFAPGADVGLSGESDEGEGPLAPEPALKEIGGYRLGKLLGAGGMGSVYEAEAIGSGRRVAVKLLSSRLASNPASVERFRQEGRLASQLAHPRCVFVLAADTEHGRPYIVMELMPGQTLKDLVDQNGPLSPHDAVARTLDIIDGLSEAHRVGMIHRDVKPSNCFLTADDRVKVGDFGLSKSLAGAGTNHLTQTGAFLGTVLFASPEQIRGESLDYGSDVYSVAATLHFLLSGQAPFHHDNAATALARAISDPAPRIRATRKDVPEQLERIILKGLERDRSRRWQTLDDMREALADLLPERQRPGRPRALVGAYLLDRIALAFLVFPAELVRMWAVDSGGKIDVFELRWLAVSITLAYFALFEGLLGATPGKMLFGLRVSRVGETGPPGVPRAFVRTFVLHAVLACFFLVPDWIIRLAGWNGGGLVRGMMFGVGALALSVQLRKGLGFRGLHDFASGCRVTQTPLRARKLRLPVPQPTPLETLLPPPPEPLPEVVGGYVVRGRLAADPTGEQVWLAEDRALGRRVLLWLRP